MLETPRWIIAVENIYETLVDLLDEWEEVEKAVPDHFTPHQIKDARWCLEDARDAIDIFLPKHFIGWGI